MKAIYKALIISAKNQKTLNIYAPGYLVVNKNGEIEAITKSNPKKKYKGYKFLDYSDYLICPGFIDVHNHLPQYAFSGIGEKELLPWLEKYTFPREKTFKNEKIAEASARTFFKDLIKNGTTTTLTYVTIHKKATDIAFKHAAKSKIRAIIGKVMMDQNSPDFLTENTNKSLKESEELIKKWHGHNDRLYYVLTPRFAITCSFESMKKVSELAKKTGAYIQTHLGENKNEIDFTMSLFPKCKNYTDVYYQAGIMGPKTIMAHCVYMKKAELDLINKTRTKIAHCPTSNRFLSSGIMPFRKYRELNLNMGLGTDVAGGYSLSMINEMKEAIESSKFANLYLKSGEPLTLSEAFYLATLGGAKVLSMDKKIGSLDKGKKADFLIIDHKKADPMAATSKYMKPDQILSKLIYRGDASMVKHVFIEGEKIK
ncbi:guanine deaminase [Patescibacteria group bacterium]